MDLPAIDPWRLEIIVVKGGSYDGGERRSMTRDVERGLLVRIRRGAYVERLAFESLSVEARHIVRMRALTAVSDAPPVFSHWSAAVLHDLPVLASRLSRVHTTVARRSERGQDGVAAHLFALTDAERHPVRLLQATSVGRTVVDVAGSARLEEGVMVGDAALRSGVPREVLLEAIDLAGPRQAAKRIGDAIAMSHPGGESAGESRSRVAMMRLGVEPPQLQWRVVLADDWETFLDFLFERLMVGGEMDGEKKLLDPRMATEGMERALLKEKRRELALRPHLRAFTRWGWRQSGSASLLAPVLAAVGVLPARARATLADYARAARGARPRPPHRVPR